MLLQLFCVRPLLVCPKTEVNLSFILIGGEGLQNSVNYEGQGNCATCLTCVAETSTYCTATANAVCAGGDDGACYDDDDGAMTTIASSTAPGPVNSSIVVITTVAPSTA